MQMGFLLALLLLIPLPAFAGTAEAKDVARGYNCKVIAINAVETSTGAAENTTYKVNCLMDATASEEQKKINGTLFIRCSGALCSLLRKGE